MAIYKTGKRKYYKYGTELDATVVGSFAKIDKGVASGFSTSQYLKYTSEVITANTFEQVIKITTGSDVTTRQAFLSQTAFKGLGTLQVLDNHLIAYISSNGSTNNITDGALSNLTLNSNTDYWIKYTFNGSTYNIDVSTNSQDYVNYISIASSSVITSDGLVGLGTDTGHPDSISFPFLGSIDLSQSYININGERWWSGDTYNKVGSWIDDGVVSGFSTSQYLTLPVPFNPSDNTWEIVFKFTTGGDISTPQGIIGNYGQSYQNSPQINIDSGVFKIWMPKDGSNTNLLQVDGTYNIQPNTEYQAKLGWTGSVYYLDYSIAGGEYVRDITVSNTTAIYQSPNPINIGFNSWGSSSTQYFLGSIDLTQSYIKINNKMWWHGTKAVETTEADAVYSAVEPDKIQDVYKSTERKYYKYGTEPNATVVGSPTIVDGVVSGFSSSNYLSLPVLFRPASNPWERVICFKTSDDVTTVQQLNYINYASDSISGVHFHMNGGKIGAQISSNGSSWDIAESFTGTTVLSANTTYYAMIRFTGSEYQLLLSTTGEFNGEETLENSITSSTPIYQSNTIYDRLGFRGSSLPQVFTGSMDLTKCYGKINNKMWWYGTKAVELNVNGSDVYQDWKQPVLTANGTLGGDKFAVGASSYYDSSRQPFNAFDGENSSSESGCWHAGSGYPQWLAFYNPKPLRVTNLKISNRYAYQGGTNAPLEYQIQTSINGSDWVTIYSGINENADSQVSWDIDLSNANAISKYMRIYITSGHDSNYVAIGELTITAQELKAIGGTVNDADYSEVPAKQIVAAYKTGKRKYYKYDYQDWEQPILSANGTMGGDKFAVRGEQQTGSPAYCAYDGNASTMLQLYSSSVNETYFYNPNPLKVSKLDFVYYPDTWITSGEIYGSNDDSNYILITTFSHSANSGSVDVNNEVGYKYFKIKVLGANGSTGSQRVIADIYTLTITAQEQISVESTSSDYDYYETPNQLVYINDDKYVKKPDYLSRVSRSNGVVYKAEKDIWLNIVYNVDANPYVQVSQSEDMSNPVTVSYATWHSGYSWSKGGCIIYIPKGVYYKSTAMGGLQEIATEKTTPKSISKNIARVPDYFTGVSLSANTVVSPRSKPCWLYSYGSSRVVQVSKDNSTWITVASGVVSGSVEPSAIFYIPSGYYFKTNGTSNAIFECKE